MLVTNRPSIHICSQPQRMEALPIPPGGDQERGWKMIGINWAMFAIELVIISLRVYSRNKIHAIGLDDYVMGLSAVSDVYLI